MIGLVFVINLDERKAKLEVLVLGYKHQGLDALLELANLFLKFCNLGIRLVNPPGNLADFHLDGLVQLVYRIGNGAFRILVSIDHSNLFLDGGKEGLDGRFLL